MDIRDRKIFKYQVLRAKFQLNGKIEIDKRKKSHSELTKRSCERKRIENDYSKLNLFLNISKMSLVPS